MQLINLYSCIISDKIIDKIIDRILDNDVTMHRRSELRELSDVIGFSRYFRKIPQVNQVISHLCHVTPHLCHVIFTYKSRRKAHFPHLRHHDLSICELHSAIRKIEPRHVDSAHTSDTPNSASVENERG
jgi:hypothetical protein